MIKGTTWKNKSGEKVNVSEMETPDLINTLVFLKEEKLKQSLTESNPKQSKRPKFINVSIKMFERERDKRNEEYTDNILNK